MSIWKGKEACVARNLWILVHVTYGKWHTKGILVLIVKRLHSEQPKGQVFTKNIWYLVAVWFASCVF